MSISVKKIDNTIVSKSVIPTKPSKPLRDFKPSNVFEDNRPKKTFEDNRRDLIALSLNMYNEFATDKSLIAKVVDNDILRERISMEDYNRPEVVRAKIKAIAAELEYDTLRNTPPALTQEQQNEFNKALQNESNVEVFNLCSQKYHIAYEPKYGGRVFIRRPTDKTFLVLMKKEGCEFGGNPNVIGVATNAGLSDLTQKEFEAIKASEPSIQTLLNAYVLISQDNWTLTNANKPIVVL